ncbi:hypothetical protein [Mesorhizobium sp. M0025]|uniref:hypothetical protein n=1 Tax=Mesorhizobium sp. M0025 TaxID=2956846 RepID=UPI003337D4F7
MDSGIDTIIIEMNPLWLLRLVQLHFRVTPLGLPKVIGGEETVAVTARFDERTLGGSAIAESRMAIVDGTIRTLALDPPVDPNSGRTPFDLDKLGSIIDPLSAMLISAVAPDGKPEPRVCDRTLPVFDGIRRYDLALSLQGSDFSNQGIWSGPRTRLSPAADATSGRNETRGCDAAGRTRRAPRFG